MLQRSKVLQAPRTGYFIHMCKSCKELQKKRMTEILFRTDKTDLYMLTVDLCAACLEGNIQLGMSYSRQWGWICAQIKHLIQILLFPSASAEVGSYSKQNQRPGLIRPFDVRKTLDVTGADDQRLLNFKFGWMLHQVFASCFCVSFTTLSQCTNCRSAQQAFAADQFLIKKPGDVYQLSYLVSFPIVSLSYYPSSFVWSARWRIASSPGPSTGSLTTSAANERPNVKGQQNNIVGILMC